MEVTTIPDIRERNDRPKDKQPKHQAASIVQRQMVQKFTKELGDSAKQSDRSDNAERAATEQVETTAREIVHEAVQFPRRVLQRPIRGESVDSPANEQPEQSDQPHHALESPRERTGTQRTRPDATPPQNIPTPAPQEQARRAYVQQTAKTATPAPPITSGQPKVQYPSTVAVGENVPRQRTDDVRTRSEPKQPQSALAPTPQEQTRRARVKRTKKSRAEKPSARDNLYTEQPEIRPADSVPQEGPPSIREKPKAPEIRGQVQSETVPAKTSAIRHAKQPDTWTPRSAAAPAMRGKEQSVRERSAVTPAHDLPPIPQEQAQQVFVEKQAQLSQNPSIESIYPSEPAAPVPPQPPVSDAPAITPERHPVTAGSGKPAPPVQPPKPAQTPPAEQLPAIREKPKPNAAPREKSRRGVDIRTRDTEQISAPKAAPKASASKTATKRARKAATQDAQRKMLKKSNNRATRAAVAAAKKLAEAAAKAVKELISALAGLDGGTALFIVFSIVIVAGAFLASPLGILFADEQQTDDALDILLENLGSLNIPMGSLTISQEDAIELLENLPDNLDPGRKAVVETAVQLVGRVSYFWGGKSLTLGWDDRWGVPTEVTAAGSGSTGTIRPFGLDCSGFVDWTFYNATNGSYYPGRGGGAATQHSYCTNISWNDAQPGDLVFYPDDSHVGIVGGKDADGNFLIVHCSGGANGVVITGSAGFTTVTRPDCF